MQCYDERGLIAESEKDGWLLGYIASPWPGPWPKLCGDLFAQAPDGKQVGLVWESKGPPIENISGPSGSRWGVYQILFPIPVFGEADLIRNFHAVLQRLMEERQNVEKAPKT